MAQVASKENFNAVTVMAAILSAAMVIFSIVCIIMFLGRLGPMTFFQVFKSNTENTSGHFEYVEADFLVG